MPNRVVLDAAVLAVMEPHARSAWPDECCGLLIGHRSQDAEHITRAVPMPNQMARTGQAGRLFEIPPQALFDVQRALRGTGDEVLGHYHSHPNGRRGPSPRDRAAIHDPQALWGILALSSAEGGLDFGLWRPDPACLWQDFCLVDWQGAL
ncbi:M67 family metallopeptidase [Insolitispirillum peregrinum]|uniref:Mov34/MPN/PAD-1 family protein n=1 Tax=Insolitispirillum peregrinum TaxID=80876 RepID=UPI00360ED0EA